MTDIITLIKIGIAALGGFVGAFLGSVDGLVITLIIFMAVDYLTGVAVGISEKKLSSETGFKGLLRKILILALVGIANCIDVYILKQGSIIRAAVIFFYLSNEGISIVENAGALGLPIPKKLKDVLEQLSKESGEEKHHDSDSEERHDE